MSARNRSVFGATELNNNRQSAVNDKLVVPPTQQTASSSASEMTFPLIEASLLITFFATLALIVNLYLLNCSRYLRKPIGVNLRLCVSLTASNAACAIFYILSNFINVLLPSALEVDGVISNCFTILIEILKISTFFASVFTLLSLALNHYYGILHPLKRHAITPNTVRTVILLAHLVPIVIYIAIFTIAPGGFRADRPFAFFSKQGCRGSQIFQIFGVRVLIAIPFILFVLIITCLYLHILIHMNKSSSDPILNSSKQQNKPATNRRLLITIMLLVGSAILGWLPTLIQYILICRECLFQLPVQYTFYISVISQLVNVLKLLADSFIYASRLIEIRYAIWKFNRSVLDWIPGCQVDDELAIPPKFARYIKTTQTSTTTLTRRKTKNAYDLNDRRNSSSNLQSAKSSNQNPTSALLPPPIPDN
ncbi:G-PROTEIN-RECEP-F1-2 domain-containing protein [Aphelenchoides bicaudatus]|nr:G-PROTEIN-RECEP-F1-2 domain-containing protein [Aphelenchoides bicaudatus]